MLVSPTKPPEELDIPRVYIERVAIVRPDAAESAFDLLMDLHGHGPAGSQRYRFETPHGDLTLEGPARRLFRRGSSAVYPVRLLGGWITSRKGLYRMRVELELLRWSGHATALGLRPVGHRHHPFGYGPYFRIGGDALTLFRKEIEAWATTVADTAA